MAEALLGMLSQRSLLAQCVNQLGQTRDIA